jgi:putative Mg2+ transporter-C (MgtC) family protein
MIGYMPVHEVATAARLLLAFALTFALGFERELRGSPAGDRTFSLIGVGTAVIGVLAEHAAPNALAGAVTGVGFIGAGVVFRQDVRHHAVVRGITTAAAIFCAAAIGAAAGEGRPLVAVTGTLLVLLSLEVRYVPWLRLLDARRWSSRFSVDEDAVAGTDGKQSGGDQ